ncbi:MAG: 23S rRNA (guanosine(2251)-2'-O)-methyltransferase RlmB [Candidatus Kapabacteria bacterium]|nr:23S rRNA (guanosine(2251)-2'-O)-methyltransferase RlmB [Candidatus Kapabacteria bacterium]MCS7169519.1 23S rRNA (guanosine(2251)-2'-O)-methyltransferase RlmB [Candidatus Kapabacteria bacterium]MDW7996301.1 23S rRNA (guanosine(2251)-2'-O)-methyltransferase RlmB [Bacteroidota bacterium]MDW8225259.1 23S rRNA (guanosine(2251)-2'-O)-methyltransferase RlmB [Bacteroidota bacterium]
MSEHLEAYIYGRRAVQDALQRGGHVQKVYVLYGSGVEESLRVLAHRAHVPCAVLDRKRFAELTRAVGTSLKDTQGVLALVSPIPMMSLLELLQRVSFGPLRLLVAVDGIEDPQNLGAIARSAEAAGADGLILPRHRAAPLTPAAVKAAAGSLLYLPVAQVPNLGTALRTLQEAGWWVFGTAPDGESLYWEALYDRAIVLVIGSEHRGMRPSIRALCDSVLRIPLLGHVQSLNAAAAAAIVLFEIQRQRWQMGLRSTLDAQPSHVSA